MIALVLRPHSPLACARFLVTSGRGALSFLDFFTGLVKAPGSLSLADLVCDRLNLRTRYKTIAGLLEVCDVSSLCCLLFYVSARRLSVSVSLLACAPLEYTTSCELEVSLSCTHSPSNVYSTIRSRRLSPTYVAATRVLPANIWRNSPKNPLYIDRTGRQVPILRGAHC